MMVHYDPEFYRGKRVFVTGHTGFKGSWLCKMLLMAGAEVTGYSLQPPTQPNLFSIAGVEDKMHSVIGDIRDFDALKAAFDAAQPDYISGSKHPIGCFTSQLAYISRELPPYYFCRCLVLSVPIII